MVDSIAAACAAIEEATGVPCVRIAPEERPAAFVVLEVSRVDADAHAEHIDVVGHVWAKSYADVVALAESAARAISEEGATDVGLSATFEATEKPYCLAKFQAVLHRLIF